MAIQTFATIQTAVSNIYNTLAAHPAVLPNATKGVEALNEVARVLVKMFVPHVTLTVTDATDADLTAFYDATGELGVALGGRDVRAGDLFKVTGTGDTTDDALQTAKGSAVAANDIFIASTASTVTYLGNAAPSFGSTTTDDLRGIA